MHIDNNNHITPHTALHHQNIHTPLTPLTYHLNNQLKNPPTPTNQPTPTRLHKILHKHTPHKKIKLIWSLSL